MKLSKISRGALPACVVAQVMAGIKYDEHHTM